MKYLEVQQQFRIQFALFAATICFNFFTFTDSVPFVKTLIRIFVDHQSENRFQLSHLPLDFLIIFLRLFFPLLLKMRSFAVFGPRAELTLLNVDFIIRLSHLQIFQTTCKIANCILPFAISLLKAKNPNRTVK